MSCHVCGRLTALPFCQASLSPHHLRAPLLGLCLGGRSGPLRESYSPSKHLWNHGLLLTVTSCRCIHPHFKQRHYLFLSMLRRALVIDLCLGTKSYKKHGMKRSSNAEWNGVEDGMVQHFWRKPTSKLVVFSGMWRSGSGWGGVKLYGLICSPLQEEVPSLLKKITLFVCNKDEWWHKL